MPNCLVPSAQDKSEGPASPRARLRLCPRLPIVLCLQHIIHAEGTEIVRPLQGGVFLLVSLYLGRRLTACPRLLNCPAPSAQIACPGRLAGTAGNLARPMLVRQARVIEGELCLSPCSTSVSFFD